MNFLCKQSIHLCIITLNISDIHNLYTLLCSVKYQGMISLSSQRLTVRVLSVEQVTKAAAPRTLRLLRQGLRPLCPVEIMLMAKDTHPAVARTAVVQDNNQTQPKLHLMYIDQLVCQLLLST